MKKIHLPRSAPFRENGQSASRQTFLLNKSPWASLHSLIGNRAAVQLLSMVRSQANETGASVRNYAGFPQRDAGGMRRPVIQRKINISPYTIKLDENFVQMVRQYNELPEDTPLSGKINALSAVERAVFQWFTTRGSEDLEEDADALQMRKLMDLLHEERRSIVEQSINRGDHERDAGDLPIAGFDALKPEVQQKVRQLWKNLIMKRGKIIISEEQQTKEGETVTHHGFSVKVLAEFSRILESEFGRSLLTRINESDRTITITPFRVGDGNVFAAIPADSENSKLRKLPQPPDDSQKALYKEIVLDGLSQQERIAVINDLRKERGDQLGVALVLKGAKHYYAFGAGSDVRVTMPSDLAESSLHYENRLIDVNGKELIAPIFSTLAHELGHAAHMQEGTVTGDLNDLIKLIDEREISDMEKLAGWSNMEEYINIQGTENRLRSEYGLGERKWHMNTPFIIRGKMYKELTDMRDNIESRSLDDQYKKPMLDMIEDTIEFIFTNWTDEQKFKEAKARVKALPSQLENLYQEALNKKQEEEIRKKEEEMGIRRSKPIDIPRARPRGEEEEVIVGGPPKSAMVERMIEERRTREEAEWQKNAFRRKYYSKLGIPPKGTGWGYKL